MLSHYYYYYYYHIIEVSQYFIDIIWYYITSFISWTSGPINLINQLVFLREKTHSHNHSLLL